MQVGVENLANISEHQVLHFAQKYEKDLAMLNFVVCFVFNEELEV